MHLSARNRLTGHIVHVKLGSVTAQVTIKVGENVIDSVITRQSADEMELKQGDTVTAIIKATEVMILKEP